jgi:hypothetical protein
MERRNKITSLFFFLGEPMKESEFQSGLIKDIKSRFPGCIVLKNDPNYIQGIPDLLILQEDRWAALEVKKSRSSKKRPNQEYYVGRMNEMSYASFIYPENKEEVLDEMELAFQRNTRRCSCRARRKSTFVA